MSLNKCFYLRDGDYDIMFYINTDYYSDEKYDLAKLIPFETDNFDVLNSYFLENFKSIPQAGTFVISVEEQRPDLISNNIYGTVFYWELLLLYNDILDLSELVNGKIIKYFSVRDLEALFFNLKSLGS